MSDVMGVQIKVEAPGAGSVIDGVEHGLAKVESRAESMNETIAKSMKDGTTSFDRLKQSTQQAVNPFDSLVAAMKREADMLQRIHGPARQYSDDLQTLDALLEKNAISTEEYAAQVTKLNRALQERNEHEEEKPNAGEKFEGGVSFAGAAVAGGAAAEAVNIFKESLGELIEASHKAEDAYTNMRNASIRYTESARDGDAVIDEQNKLAEELHSTFGPTVELYGRVKEGSDALNLSHEEQIELTKTLGQEVQLAGHPLADAAGLMTRFSFAMQTGHIEARQLKQIMTEVPGITDIWKQAFGKNVGAILSDVKNGKISVDELVRALVEQSHVADKQFESHKATNEVLKEQFVEEWNINNQRQKALSFSEKIQESQYALQEGTITYAQLWAKLDDEEDAFEKHLSQNARDALGNLGVLTNDLHQTWTKLSTEAGDFARTLGAIGDNWDQQLGRVGRSFKIAGDEAAKLGNAKQQLQGIKDVVAAGGTIVDAREREKQLVEEIGGEYVKYLDSIKAPMEDYERHLNMINSYWENGRLSAKQYADEIRKLGQSIGLVNQGVNITDTFVATGNAALRRASGHGALSGDGSTRAEQFGYQGILAPQLDIAEPDSTAAPQESEALKSIMSLYEETRTAAEKYADQVAEVNRLSKEANITDQARDHILGNLKDKYESSLPSFFDDSEKNDPLKQYEERAKKTAEALKTAFEPVAKMLTDAAKTGEVSWSEFGSSVEDMILKLITDELELKAAAALSGLLNGPAPASGLGAAASGLDLGGGGGMGSLGSLLNGFADGGYLDIPHAANGLAGLVPMRSGRDDHLLSMFVRTGEDVTVRTPEQRRDAEHAAANANYGPPPGGDTYVIMQQDHRALSPAVTDRDRKVHLKLRQEYDGRIRAR